MKFTRRKFLAGIAAATTAAALPKRKARAAGAAGGDTVATLIDLTRCDGCQEEEAPLCVAACRNKNAHRFPEPDRAMLKDYWPKKYHEDWSGKREIDWRLTPYNWTFIEEVHLSIDGREKQLNIPRRCMHCDDPPCVKLCPFGTAKKEKNGPVHIDPSLCFGGAKCRSVCPWNVPQRQAGVGIYTALDPLPLGAGVMYKCDLCRDLLAEGKEPACIPVCPKKAMHFGAREKMEKLAEDLVDMNGGYLYGLKEHGGTSTIYYSDLSFDRIDQALIEDVPDPKTVMRFHEPENQGRKQNALAKAALLAPLAGIAGVLVAAVAKKEDKTDD